MQYTVLYFFVTVPEVSAVLIVNAEYVPIMNNASQMVQDLVIVSVRLTNVEFMH